MISSISDKLLQNGCGIPNQDTSLSLVHALQQNWQVLRQFPFESCMFLFFGILKRESHCLILLISSVSMPEFASSCELVALLLQHMSMHLLTMSFLSWRSLFLICYLLMIMLSCRNVQKLQVCNLRNAATYPLMDSSASWSLLYNTYLWYISFTILNRILNKKTCGQHPATCLV